jgi:hypothetical protein
MNEQRVNVLSANKARALSPKAKPISRELWKKVMAYTFDIIDKRGEAGYEYVEASLTTFPALESRRIKVLKRLGYSVREHEFALFIGWEKNE